jgi:hypothetical protein
MTPAQRRHLQRALELHAGELRIVPAPNGGGGALIRMVRLMQAAGLVAFDPKRMAWCVTTKGRAALREPPRAPAV